MIDIEKPRLTERERRQAAQAVWIAVATVLLGIAILVGFIRG